MLLLLVFIPLNNTKYVAYAADIGDVTVTSYSYQSSNIFVPTKRTYPNSDASTHIDYLVFKILVSTNGTNPSASDYIKVDYDFSLFFAANTSASQKNNYFYLPSFYNTSSYVPASNTIVKAYNGESWYQFITYRTAGFNANVSKIVFTNTYKSSNADGFNEIYFYTPTDDYLLFRFYIPVDDPSAYFTPRTYYIGSYDAEDSNYQFGYNNGYTFGYEDGVSSGKFKAYHKAIAIVKEEGQ